MSLIRPRKSRNVKRFTLNEDIFLKEVHRRFGKKLTTQKATDLLNESSLSPKMRTESSVRYRLAILKRVRSLKKLHNIAKR